MFFGHAPDATADLKGAVDPHPDYAVISIQRGPRRRIVTVAPRTRGRHRAFLISRRPSSARRHWKMQSLSSGAHFTQRVGIGR
jgi:hypothetical protein